MRALLVPLLFAVAFAQPDDQIHRVGKNVSAPKIIRKKEPEFTNEARSAQVQGSVLFSIVIDTEGKPTDITLISPLGFGLDEQAQKAIETWRFEPAEMDGRPVKVHANVEVNFRLPDYYFDQKQERRRTAHNAALRGLSSGDPDKVKKAVETIQDLAGQKYPASVFVYASVLREGKLLPKDEEKARQHLLFAAEKNFGPAVYEVGLMYLEGRGVPKDEAKAIGMMKEASVLGSAAAQYRLGSMSESGTILPKDTAAAKRYYRLCAAAGQAPCQLGLAKSLIGEPDRAEKDYIQAMAWLQLAAGAGHAEAKRVLDEEWPKLTPEQAARAKDLQPQLLRKR